MSRQNYDGIQSMNPLCCIMFLLVSFCILTIQASEGLAPFVRHLMIHSYIETEVLPLVQSAIQAVDKGNSAIVYEAQQAARAATYQSLAEISLQRVVALREENEELKDRLFKFKRTNKRLRSILASHQRQKKNKTNF